jgi:hypothetical protein
MAQMIIRDHSLWTKHIEGSAKIVDTILNLNANSPLRLKIDGKPILFRKMRNGAGGRPTNGIRPDDAFKDDWKKLYETKRGKIVNIELDENAIIDPYLDAISTILTEWDSEEDNEAFNGL